MKKIIYDKDVFVIEDFLSEKTCQELIAKSEKLGYEEAKVQTGENTQAMMKSVRNNDRILFKDQDMAQLFFDKAKAYLPQEIGIYTLKDLNEMFRFYRYTPTQRFKKHRDGSYIRNAVEKSWYTFLIYLNDDFKGGETEFESIGIVKPKQGALLVFYHSCKHEGKTVLEGTKYALRTDVMYTIKEKEK